MASNSKYSMLNIKLLLAILFVLACVPLLAFGSGGNNYAGEAVTLESQNEGGLNSLFSSIGNKLGLGADDSGFVPPEKAFIFGSEVTDPYTVKLYWDIREAYYLYSDRFKVSIKDAEGIEIKELIIPKGKEKFDENFGLMDVHYRDVAIELWLNRTNKNATAIQLEVTSQGCAEAGFCYPPIKQIIDIELPKAGAEPQRNQTTPATAGYMTDQDRYAQSLASDSILLTLLSFFGLGLLLAFTPCVFPMIPILSSIIAGQGDNITSRRAFTLSLVYVLAMAVTYTIAGVLAGLFGANLQAAFQNPWILGSFSALFVLLSLSMFGFYELQLPNKWQSKLTETSNKQQGGKITGVAVMGVLSALIVGPCVAAPLAGALIYIGQTGDAVLGGSALFALSLGMGAPLLIIGTSAGKLLPKAGPWMDAIKAVFGVMLLAVAIWLLERIIPGPIALALWGSLLVVSAIYLGATEHLKPEASGWNRLWKGIGVILLIYGALLFIGASTGGNDMLRPLANMGTAQANNIDSKKLQFQTIKGLDGLEQALKQAEQQNRYVMLDFYADWCVSCKEMEVKTFSDSGVQQALSNVMLLKADVTANDEADQALMQKFGLFGPPSILLFTPEKQELSQFRLMGFLDADAFETHIRTALNR